MSAPSFSRVYRAFVSPLSVSHSELTVFVEASSRDGARRHICELVALITRRTVDDVENALYNLSSAQELLDEGVSESPGLRLFECGWSCEGITYVESPLFLVTDPTPLLQTWIKTRDAVDVQGPATEDTPSPRSIASTATSLRPRPWPLWERITATIVWTALAALVIAMTFGYFEI